MEEYSDELIEEIKDNIDIVDFIGEYVDLRRKEIWDELYKNRIKIER